MSVSMVWLLTMWSFECIDLLHILFANLLRRNGRIQFPGNMTYVESSDHIKLSADDQGIKNAVLTIESAVLEDREFYNCTGTNRAIKYGNAGYPVAVEATYVRVKGSSLVRQSQRNVH